MLAVHELLVFEGGARRVLRRLPRHTQGEGNKANCLMLAVHEPLVFEGGTRRVLRRLPRPHPRLGIKTRAKGIRPVASCLLCMKL
ncbi:hypothetical protein D3C73_1530170 [compost metagenome]